MTLKLRHTQPQKELSNVVRSFFELSYSTDADRSDYLLPSGRIAFFHIKTEKEFQVEFEGSENVSVVNSGYYLAFIDGTAKYTHSKMNVIAASIYPVYLGLVFKIKPRDILNTFTRLNDLIDLEKADLPTDVDNLSTPQLVGRMQRFIHSQLNENPIREDVELIYNKIVEAKAYNLSVSELAYWMGYSERHISNIFQEHVGLSPKRFIQLTRFNQSLKLIDDLESFPKLSDIAYEMGYHDHAHFIRDFKQFCGKTPREIRAEKKSAAYLFRKARVD
ncbi:helix-turn-helix domain-containing protein [Roseivirga pacifica]|uniref:helix-turn-helix domain-containing protein n=1 Tax=Roseivirga pacifica TaxID=1267423 RepID=UPI00209659C3|nr:helix-turn-helix domain-containing protein [Roseivirga pacifica]MCO6357080.1 helix-turn-helix domain-containing protein [Roseivirga pacifica]MCO6368207.1 helix-turn-helix domain-containing protein [Roseivirga pacifica]MCO6369312.1 helix-turn-helix domain-containing protein [Roseivirga pacifica]MCO6373166.1 helix-turn-helix domain-containing protein [Roseivirga pacifica]MCO6377577.1 helix-turn-helix domain-containing protein [Roseivirga pacifica]